MVTTLGFGAASQLGTVLAKAVGLDPDDVRCVDLHLKPGGLATATFEVVIMDEAGLPLTEDGEIVTAVRQFQEVQGE